MVTYAGYMIPVFAMKRWLFWLFYLNPLSYAYEALFANEFGRLQVSLLAHKSAGGLECKRRMGNEVDVANLPLALRQR